MNLSHFGQIGQVALVSTSLRRLFPLKENLGDTLRDVPIPERRDATDFRLALQYARDFHLQALRIVSDENVGSHRECHWSLGVGTERQTWDAQISRFFLNAARIGNDYRGRALQCEKTQIRKRCEQVKRAHIHAARLNSLSGHWMKCKYSFQMLANLEQRFQDLPQLRALVYVRRPMQSHQCISVR